MSSSNKLELTTNELLSRCWTRTLIKRFLPRPDGSVSVDHWANYRGQDTFAATKVWNIEQSDEFGVAFLRSWKGRTKGRMKDNLPEEVLSNMREAPHPELPVRTKEDVKRDTLIAEFTGALGALRGRGFRTPHKG
jgi:hypothetical protein